MIVRKQLSIWYSSLIFLILTIIIVGGITRLTGSGLSMVDWRPVMGILPPLNEVQWLQLFDQYKQFPEYKIINTFMTLPEFKFIFFWEYIHRILGRIIGLSMILPFFYFLYKKILSKKQIKHSILMICLVITQGFVGWFMVKSGLVDNPRVSHFRLALHFSLALVLLCFCIASLANLYSEKIKKPAFTFITSTFFTLLITQLIYGAFTAGLKAGLGYNSYPKMNGEWLPDAAFNLPSLFSNLIHNPVMIQFIHRHLALLVLCSFLVCFFKLYFFSQSKLLKKLSILVFVLLVCQILLGILTLLHYVPLTLAIIHQFLAVILVMASFLLCYFSRYTFNSSI